MVDPIDVTLYTIAALTLLGVGALILVVGYQAYLARTASDLKDAEAALEHVDHIAQMRETNAAIALNASQAREALERARDAVRYGATGR